MSDFLLRRTLPPHLAEVGRCSTCGKASYLSRRDARRAGKAFHPDAHSWVYQCGQLWHVTTSKRPRWAFRRNADA
jgi:hypothetical protein